MKLNIKTYLKKIMQNKPILYLLFAIALLNILGFLASNNNGAILLFFTIAFCCSYVSKNMILILFVSLVATNVITKLHLAFLSLKEGMEHEGDGENEDEDEYEYEYKYKYKYEDVEDEDVDELKNVDDNDKEEMGDADEEMNHKYMKEIFGENLKNMDTTQPIMQLNDENTKKIMAKIDEMSPVLNNATKLLNTLQTSGMLKSIMKGSGFLKNLTN